VRSAELDRNVPPEFRDPGETSGFGLTLRGAHDHALDQAGRARTRVTTYAGLGELRAGGGKLCLRNSASDYNVSFVADRIAKDGHAATKAMLRRWMANNPTILGSDTDVLATRSRPAAATLA